jgi:hypothetical protein
MNVARIADLVEKWCSFPPHVRQRRHPLFFVGNTGIGKTQGVAQGVSDAGKILVTPPPPSTMLPEDAGGIPFPNEDHTLVRYIPPSYWDIKPNSVLFLDELNLAATDVLNALCSVLVPLGDGHRYIGSHRLPDDLVVIGAGMPTSHGMSVRPLPPHLRSRLTVINVEATVDDWINWAVRNSVEESVISYINSNREMLAPKAEKGFAASLDPIPTPRGWAAVSEYVYSFERFEDRALLLDMIAGLIGPGGASEFMTFRDNMDRLPDPLAVLDGREKFPQRADCACACAASIASYVIEARDESVGLKWVDLTLTDAIPREYVVGMQMSAFSNLKPKDRKACGVFLATIANQRPAWIQKYSSAMRARRQWNSGDKINE